MARRKRARSRSQPNTTPIILIAIVLLAVVVVLVTGGSQIAPDFKKLPPSQPSSDDAVAPPSSSCNTAAASVQTLLSRGDAKTASTTKTLLESCPDTDLSSLAKPTAPPEGGSSQCGDLHRAADINNDNIINVLDIVQLLGAWGPCSGCVEDFNGDGVVNVNDLRIILSLWTNGAKFVATAQDLDNVRNDLDADYIQICNIDLSGENWLPIGVSENPSIPGGWSTFTGTYDGDGYNIDNLFIDRTEASGFDLTLYVFDLGLFHTAGSSDVGIGSRRAILKNINIRNAEIKGAVVGGILLSSGRGASNYAAQPGPIIENVHVSGTIQRSLIYYSNAAGSIGGLVGHARKTIIRDSSADVEIQSLTAGYTGGLVGTLSSDLYYYEEPSQIIRSTAKGSLTMLEHPSPIIVGLARGGLVGKLDRGSIIQDSFADTVIHGDTDSDQSVSGGLVGVMTSYSTGLESKIINSYAKGHLGTDEGKVGGLVGRMYFGVNSDPVPPSVTTPSSYWDVETSGQSTSAGGEGRTTAEMTSVPLPENTYDFWDFQNVWSHEVDGEYPILR